MAIRHNCDHCRQEIAKGGNHSVTTFVPGDSVGMRGFDLCGACHVELLAWLGVRLVSSRHPATIRLKDYVKGWCAD